MVNKYYERVEVTDTLIDPGGTEHTGTISGGGDGGGNAWSDNGTIAPEHDVLVYVTELGVGETITIGEFTLIHANGGPPAGGIELDIVHVGGDGSISFAADIVLTDGVSQYVNESSNADYTNTTGSSEIIAVAAQNPNSTTANIMTNGTVHIT